ncbi:MAG: hypothetical protein ABJO88_18250 [Parasphingorhabdus sp.]
MTQLDLDTVIPQIKGFKVANFIIKIITYSQPIKGETMEQDIPHGHGLSFKKGVSDGLLERNDYAADLPNGHNNSYALGVEEGAVLRQETALRVRPKVL